MLRHEADDGIFTRVPLCSTITTQNRRSILKINLELVPASDDTLEPLWRELEARADASFFLSWHWIGCWLSSIEERPLLLVARGGERVVGLALLGCAVVRRHRGLVRVPTLHLNQTGDETQDVVTTEYNDILADRELAPAVRRACLEHLLAVRRLEGGRRVEAIAWRGAVEAGLLDLLADAGRPWRLVAEAPSSRVDLAALRASGLPFLRQVSPNTRHQIRRSLALYEERYGPLRLEVAATVDAALVFFHAAGTLHQARWEPRGKPGAFAYPFYIRFHERLINDGLPEGVVEMVRISAGDVPIGYLYNFLYRGRVYYYFSGFRYEADNRLKPGLVSHALCIERHLARGMDVYDFMAGDNRYKTSLGQPGPRMIGVVLEWPRPMLQLESWLRKLKRTRFGSGGTAR